MLKLFGQARSRVSRSLWMLEEIGIPYQREPVRPYTESRSTEYLRVNPNGHIPSLDDDGFILWESLAINLYLAETYASPPLWPAGAKDHGRIYQWSLWAANEIEPRIVSIAKGLSKTSPDPQSRGDWARAALRCPSHLEGQAACAISPGRELHPAISTSPRLCANLARRESPESPRSILRPSRMSPAGSIAAARGLPISASRRLWTNQADRPSASPASRRLQAAGGIAA